MCGDTMKKKSIVYVDGFNLFYGLLKNEKNKKWLNLQHYFEKLRTDDDIEKIKYFTTLVKGKKRDNQESYLKALSTLPKVQIVLGKFKTQTYTCLINCGYTGDKTYADQIEKRTDVNIASHFVADSALLNDIEKLIIVSGDSDLIPAIKMAKQISPQKQIIVYVPHDPVKSKNSKKVSSDIRKAADKHKNLPVNLIGKSQFDNEITDNYGNKICKPLSW